MKKTKKVVSLLITTLCILNILVVTAASYKYDALGRLVEVLYSSGGKITYTYDAGGNILNVQHSNFKEPDIGDINNDGEINSTDYARVLRHILRQDTITEKEIKYADVDGNGVVNSIDYAYIKQYLLGKINSLPYEN